MSDLPSFVALRYPTPYVGFQGKPGVWTTDLQPGSQSDRREQLDSWGFRNAIDPSAQTPLGACKVFVVGGSTVFHGSTPETTIPGTLQSLFRATGRKDVIVYNCGSVSHVSGQELSLLVHRLSDARPDLVIIYDGGNDLYQTAWFDPRPGYPFNHYQVESVLSALRLNTQADGHTVVQLENFSMNLNAYRTAAGYGTPEWQKASRDIYLNNLRKMSAFGSAMGIRMAFFLQPLLFTKTDLNEQEQAQLDKLSEGFRGYMARQCAEIRPSYAAFAEEVKARGQVAVDMMDCLSGRGLSAFEADFIHVTDAANTVIAETMFPVLKRQFSV